MRLLIGTFVLLAALAATQFGVSPGGRFQFHPALVVTVAAEQPGQPATEEFVPIDQLPVDEQMPAAPLLIIAYIVVWVGVVAYLWSIWRRLQKVEAELSAIAPRIAGRGDAR